MPQLSLPPTSSLTVMPAPPASSRTSRSGTRCRSCISTWNVGHRGPIRRRGGGSCALSARVCRACGTSRSHGKSVGARVPWHVLRGGFRLPGWRLPCRSLLRGCGLRGSFPRGSRLRGSPLCGRRLPRAPSGASRARLELGVQGIDSLLSGFRRQNRFLERQMQPAQLIAHSQTRLVASDRAARVLAVAEEGLAQAALRGLIRRDEIVEVLVHDRESLPTRRSLEREETTRAQGHP